LKNITKKILPIFYLAVIAGFIYGVFKSIEYISVNNYIGYKMYSLIFFDIVSITTDYFLYFFILSIFLILFAALCKKLAGFRTALWLILISIAILVSAFTIYFYSANIITFLKSFSLTRHIGSISESKKDTHFIFISLLSVVALALSSLVAYSIWTDSINRLLSKIANRVNTGFIKSLSLVLISLIILSNISLLAYINLYKGNGPNIVFITIDTLRADHLSSYGNPRNTTPNIDKIAEKGVLFENAISQAPWTLPSMMSMFTSLYPSELGAKGIGYKVKYSILTIPEYMRNNFYNTIGVTSHIIVSKVYKFDQGFNTFNQDPITRVEDLSSEMLTDKAIEYVNANKDDKFFLWVHYLDPHQNYINNAEFNYTDDYSGNLGEILDNKFLNQKTSALDIEDVKYIKDVYDEEISYTDKHIGRLLDTIEGLGLSDNTIIVLTADHGEEFLERTRIGHGSSLHKELTHVPLIIYDPHDSKNSGKRITNNIETRNIAKTMTEIAGLDENIFEGINIMDSKNLASSHIVISENYGYKKGQKQESIIYDNWKLLGNLQGEKYELYNLENDREEKKNLIANIEDKTLEKKEKLQAMMSIIRENDSNKSDDLELNPEEIKQLKALGYIQ